MSLDRWEDDRGAIHASYHIATAAREQHAQALGRSIRFELVCIQPGLVPVYRWQCKTCLGRARKLVTK
jgi:hypothetical protein